MDRTNLSKIKDAFSNLQWIRPPWRKATEADKNHPDYWPKRGQPFLVAFLVGSWNPHPENEWVWDFDCVQFHEDGPLISNIGGNWRLNEDMIEWVAKIPDPPGPKTHWE